MAQGDPLDHNRLIQEKQHVRTAIEHRRRRIRLLPIDQIAAQTKLKLIAIPHEA
ncbi:hypothetical protein ACSBOB_03725 [Mesorhizobium sp. ASY16-5R]|uniref:hypothetical protein n=1 Tax=Mesorhizobium sp. ASY16-5R TaxID=3445772 RepID=UPI003F9F2EFD